MPSIESLSYAADAVRHRDRDRYATAVFAPSVERERLLALYAFNAEIAAIAESIREPVAGLIRMQWWADALAGIRDPEEIAGHPIASRLLPALAERGIGADTLEPLLEARRADLDPQGFADMVSLEAYADATSGLLSAVAARLLDPGAEAEIPARMVGTAFALVGLMRAVPHRRAMGRPVFVLETDRRLTAMVRQVCERAAMLLAGARLYRVSRAALPALLPAVVASAHLRTLARARWDPFDPRVTRPRPMPVQLALHALFGRF